MGSWFTLMFALLVASKVQAQQTRDLVRDGHGGLRVQLDVGQVRCPPCPNFEGYVVGITTELHQRIATVAPGLHLEFDLEAVGGVSGTRAADGEWLGSPWLGVSVAHRTAAQTMRLSLGVAPPLRTAMRNFGSTYESGGVWGRWNEWLGLPGMVPFGLLGMSEWRSESLDVGVDAALVLAPTFNADPTIVVPAPALFSWASVGVWLGGHVIPELDLGLRAQGVLHIVHHYGLPGFASHTSADVQVSAVPFVRYNNRPWFAELRVQLNLNEPFGPPLSFDGVWAMNLQVGSSW